MDENWNWNFNFSSGYNNSLTSTSFLFSYSLKTRILGSTSSLLNLRVSLHYSLISLIFQRVQFKSVSRKFSYRKDGYTNFLPKTFCDRLAKYIIYTRGFAHKGELKPQPSVLPPVSNSQIRGSSRTRRTDRRYLRSAACGISIRIPLGVNIRPVNESIQHAL